MFPRQTPPSEETGARRTSVQLPPELLQKARGRLKFLAALIGALCLISSIIGAIELSMGGYRYELLILYLAVFCVSAAVFLACRSRGIGHSLVLRIGLVYEVLICSVISTTFNWLNFVEVGVAPLATWTSIWIVVFPLIIPSRPMTTLIVAFLAAVTSPLSVFVLDLVGAAEPVPYDYFVASVSPALCIIIAVASSKVIYGMSLDVARARELGSYQLVEQLGKGGMGEVWLAKHKMLARPAAIKLISTRTLTGDSASSEAMLKRFEREAQATAQLQSAHTVEVYDFGVTDDGAFYYVMELMDGQDLDDLVKQFGPVPAERAAHILIQACHSLAEAHHSGMIHRDIKPANIFLCKKGLDYDYVKVLDFGLVKNVFIKEDSSSEITVDGNITGTPAFIAPEIALGKKDIDGRADLYALGCVAYWLLTGCMVFEADTPMGVVMEHVKTEPVKLSARTEVDVPKALEDAVHACLAKEPGDRPQSASELAERLSKIEFESPWTPQRAERWWSLHQHKDQG
jgi:serine/threonine-protein kinase